MRKVMALAIVFITFLVSAPKGLGKNGDIVEKFLSRGNEQLNSYVAVRSIRAHNLKTNWSATMTVETTLRNSNKLSYVVIEKGGSDFIQGKIRKGLNQEVEETAKLHPERVDFTENNYMIRESEEQFPDLVQLYTKPLRKESMLIDGSLFVTETGDLVRVEGRLVKNPSFWTKDVDIVKVYDRINGISVPVFLESTAQVRIVGTSTLTITYSYLSVNGLPITADK